MALLEGSSPKKSDAMALRTAPTRQPNHMKIPSKQLSLIGGMSCRRPTEATTNKRIQSSGGSGMRTKEPCMPWAHGKLHGVAARIALPSSASPSMPAARIGRLPVPELALSSSSCQRCWSLSNRN